MNKALKEKLLVKEKWIRLLAMIFFAIIKHLVSSLITVIALFQFIANLITSQPNARIMGFSRNLNIYLLQIADFLTYNSENKPFPFSDWPTGQS